MTFQFVLNPLDFRLSLSFWKSEVFVLTHEKAVAVNLALMRQTLAISGPIVSILTQLKINNLKIIRQRVKEKKKISVINSDGKLMFDTGCQPGLCETHFLRNVYSAKPPAAVRPRAFLIRM